jgi:hypothetical protein
MKPKMLLNNRLSETTRNTLMENCTKKFVGDKKEIVCLYVFAYDQTPKGHIYSDFEPLNYWSQICNCQI